jgi:hypothetical protein
MMDELLLNIYGPEQLKVVVNCLKTLSAFNNVDTWPTIEQFLAQDSTIENMAKKMYITNLLKADLQAIAKAHYVFIDESTPLHLMNFIVFTLFESVTNYDPEAVLREVSFELGEDNTTIDSLLNLVEFITGVPAMGLYDYVILVDATVIKNIVKALKMKVIPDIEFTSPEFKTRYLKFIGDVRKGLIYELVATGAPIGNLSAESLVTLYEEALEDLPIIDKAYEATCLILISSDEVTKAVIDLVAMFITDNALDFDRLTTNIRANLGVSNEN